MGIESREKPSFRHELKYIISEVEKQVIIARIKQILKFDPHAGTHGYTIRSLYFDDRWNRAYEDKMSGVARREKYRIRIYNYSDKVIKLERKIKQGAYIYKQATTLSREETEKLRQGDFLFLEKRKESLCQEFYVECKANGMSSRVIVDYERIPFILEAGEVRITFDTDIRAGMLSYDIFDQKLPMLSCLEPGTLVMEVKYTEFLPQLIRNILPPEQSEYIAVSKYVLCYNKRYGILE